MAPTGYESAGLKAVVDALIALYHRAKDTRLKNTAEAALTEAIRELLMAPSDLRSAQTKIALAKAAGIISADLILAEELLTKSADSIKRGKSARPATGPTKPAVRKTTRTPRKPAVAKPATTTAEPKPTPKKEAASKAEAPKTAASAKPPTRKTVKKTQ